MKSNENDTTGMLLLPRPVSLPKSVRKLLLFDDADYDCSRFTYKKGFGVCDEKYAYPPKRDPDVFNAYHKHGTDIMHDIDLVTDFARYSMPQYDDVIGPRISKHEYEHMMLATYDGFMHRYHEEFRNDGFIEQASSKDGLLMMLYNASDPFTRYFDNIGMTWEYHDDGSKTPRGTAMWDFVYASSQKTAYDRTLAEHRMKHFLDASMLVEGFHPIDYHDFIKFNFNDEIQPQGIEHYNDGLGRLAVTLTRAIKRKKTPFAADKRTRVFLISDPRELDEVLNIILYENPQYALVFLNNNCSFNGGKKSKGNVNTYYSLTFDIDSPSQEQVTDLLTAIRPEEDAYHGGRIRLPRPNCITTTCTGLHLVYTLRTPMRRASKYHTATWQGLEILNECMRDTLVEFCGKKDKDGGKHIDKLPLSQAYGLSGFPTKQRANDFQDGRDIQGERMETYNTYLVTPEKTSIASLLSNDVLMERIYHCFQRITDGDRKCPRPSLNDSRASGRQDHLRDMGLNMKSPRLLRLSMLENANAWCSEILANDETNNHDQKDTDHEMEALTDTFLLMQLSWSTPGYIEESLKNKEEHIPWVKAITMRNRQRHGWRGWQPGHVEIKHGSHEADEVEMVRYAIDLGIESLDDVTDVPDELIKDWTAYPVPGEWHHFYRYQALVAEIYDADDGMFKRRYKAIFELTRAARVCRVPLSILWSDITRLKGKWNEVAIRLGNPSFNDDDIRKATRLTEKDMETMFCWNVCYDIIECEDTKLRDFKNLYRRIKRNGCEFSGVMTVPLIALAIVNIQAKRESEGSEKRIKHTEIVDETDAITHDNGICYRSVTRHRDEAEMLIKSLRSVGRLDHLQEIVSHFRKKDGKRRKRVVKVDVNTIVSDIRNDNAKNVTASGEQRLGLIRGWHFSSDARFLESIVPPLEDSIIGPRESDFSNSVGVLDVHKNDTNETQKESLLWQLSDIVLKVANNRLDREWDILKKHGTHDELLDDFGTLVRLTDAEKRQTQWAVSIAA